MQLRLKTKITLTTAALVLAVVGVNSTIYVMNLTRQVIRQADDRAQLVSRHIFFEAQNALVDAAKSGQTPASDSAEDLRGYVQRAFDDSAPLASSIDAEVGYSPLIYEISITDVDGAVLVSSDKSLPGKSAPERTRLSRLVSSGFVDQLKVLYGPPRAYEVDYAFQIGPPGNQIPFGVVRVAVQTGLLRISITPALRSAAIIALVSVGISVLLAAIVSSISLGPLKRITAQLDRISKGEFDQTPLDREDEFGQVSSKISQIGMQLRGVREIFSNLRENIDQVLGGLDDGLLLFSVDGRAVMVSPAVERFLSTTSDQLLGRRAEDIFPPDHEAREAIKVQNGELVPVASAEVVLSGIDGPPRQGRRQRRSHRRRRRANGHAREIQGPRVQGAHRHAVAGFRAPRQSWTNHRGRGPRSEKSPELDAHLAGKSESQLARRGWIAAAGRPRFGQRNRPAGQRGETLSRFHASTGDAPGGIQPEGTSGRGPGGGASRV